MVQNKLALTRFVHALAWATTVWALALWVGILIDRIFRLRPPQVAWFIWGGLGAAVLVSLVYALMRRPTAHEAAVAIDEKLALKEKFSTALYARPLNDPFAQAAVKDAELTADNVSLHKRFPLVFPRQSLGTAGIGILVALTLAFMPTMDLFGKQAAREEENRQQQKTEETRKLVERALKVVVETETKGVADEEAIKQAKLDLQPLVNAPIKDPDKARRTVARALSELEQSLKKQMASNQRIADVEADSKAFKSLTPGDDEKGPVADAQRKIAKGEFGDAVDELSKAVSKFDKMDEKEQQKAAEQMQKMAQQLQQMANNPQQQQQAQQQMQQLGLTPQQAQKAQELMQQAAQGDKQAQQQLQQMAQKAMQQMNNGQGPTQQQQQQLQQMMKQMQAQANNQAQANQMAQAAQQMAQAMKQAQQQQGQPGAQQAGQQAQQQMAQAQQQLNQQLQAMQAMKADAQQVAAAQAATVPTIGASSRTA